MYLLNVFTNLLPAGLQPYAKALWPAVGTIVAVGAQYASTGEIDTAAVATAVTGGFAALVTLLIPNKPVEPDGQR